jgi:hypothetical protein
MKKTILLLSLFVVTLAFTFKPEPKTLRDELVKYNVHDQKILFQQLTTEERESLWSERFKQESKFHKGEKKRALIKLSKQMNGIDISKVKEIEDNIVALFGKEEAFRLLVSFRLPDDSNVAVKFLNQHASADNSTVTFFCESCHVNGINWCNSAGSGQRIKCVIGSCDTGGYSNYGCGTFFLYSCDGQCDIPRLG